MTNSYAQEFTRMRLVLSLTMVLTCSQCVDGQTVIDSLKTLLRSEEGDSTKYKLYGTLSWEYGMLNTPASLAIAVQYADSIKLLAQKRNDDYGLTFAAFYYGIVNRRKGNYHEAIENINQFVMYRKLIGDSLAVAKGVFQIGAIYASLGNHSAALTNYYRTRSIYEQLSYQEGLVNILNSIGVVLKNMNNYEAALKIYHEALAMLDTVESLVDKANVCGNLANVYAAMKDYDKATHFHKLTLALDEELNDTWGIAMDFDNIGTMLIEQQKYDSALVYQLRALNLRKEKLPGEADLAVSYNKVGYTYFKLGKNKLAEESFMRSLEIARRLDIPPILRDIYGPLSEFYASTGDFDRAYSFFKLHTSLKDSILNATTAQQINELHTKYETDKKDQQISLLAKEKEIQANETERQSILKKIFIAGLMLVSLLTVLIVYVYRQKSRNREVILAKNKEVSEANFKRQMSELELKALRAQINPHFLFNCMNSINRMILEGENENASQYLAKFSKLMRLILENAENAKVSLQNELTLLESYIQLEGLRFKGRINYKITVDESVDVNGTYLPSLVLQPFVENAIWHGLMHKGDNERGMLEISVIEKEGRLYCTIEDNGVGREKARLLAEKSVLKTKSMGMRITEERLRLLSKHNWERLINIVDLKDPFNNALGTRVEINFPLS